MTILDPHFRPSINRDHLLYTRLAMVGAYEQLPDLTGVQAVADAIAMAVDVFRKLCEFDPIGQAMIRSIALSIQSPPYLSSMRRKIRRYARELGKQ